MQNVMCLHQELYRYLFYICDVYVIPDTRDNAALLPIPIPYPYIHFTTTYTYYYCQTVSSVFCMAGTHIMAWNSSRFHACVHIHIRKYKVSLHALCRNRKHLHTTVRFWTNSKMKIINISRILNLQAIFIQASTSNVHPHL